MTDLQQIPLHTITGGDASLADYAGQVLLVVNVASKCGLTPQYDGLEKLYERYRDKGFTVLGFPANDFAGQEPGTDAEIADFCRTNFSVAFPMFAKIAVTGSEQHPLYRELVAAMPQATDPNDGAFRRKLEGYGMTVADGQVMWNFEKFLIGRDGQVTARFTPDTTPDNPALITAIERELFTSE